MLKRKLITPNKRGGFDSKLKKRVPCETRFRRFSDIGWEQLHNAYEHELHVQNLTPTRNNLYDVGITATTLCLVYRLVFVKRTITEKY